MKIARIRMPGSILVIAAVISMTGVEAAGQPADPRRGTRETKPAERAPSAPRRAEPEPVRLQVERNALGMELALVPGGSFVMGAERGQEEEQPAHRVTLTEFYLSRHEVTQSQWEAVMSANPSHFKGAELPVESISWDDAQEFIKRLNERQDGFRYRLPTEAEWEYACRAGSRGDYAGGLDEVAWRFQNSEAQTHPVGAKRPNAWGLFDLHGNVWEWCEDVYHENYNGAPSDGSAWREGGEASFRIIRGGSWNDSAAELRSSAREERSRGNRSFNVGLRLAATRP